MKCPKCHHENPDDTYFCGKCATQIRPLKGDIFAQTMTVGTSIKVPDKGTLFARKYKIVGELGRGGMGVVYLAEDTKLKRTVALKFLPPELSSNPEAKERFVREAQAAAVLDHPNICAVHEIEEAEGVTYIAMAYVEGQNLREKISKRLLAVDRAVDVALQVAEGLDAAHKHGIIHRDIKSGNIMMMEDGQAKILDFGLAKVSGESVITRDAKTMGTVAYMSPEQARGEATDRRTDVWSLGVVLYEMLTGELPFRGERETSIMYAIVHEEPKPLQKLRTGVPFELANIVGKALKKDRNARYATAGEMARDLKRYRDSARAEAAQIFNTGSLLRRLRKPLVAIPAALLMIAIACLAYWFFHRQAKVRYARNEILPKITRLWENLSSLLDLQKIYGLAVEAEKYIADDPKLAEIFERYSNRLTMTTDPPGADVFIKGYHALGEEWMHLGVTPIESLRFPLEFFRLKLEKPGYETVLAAGATLDFDRRTAKPAPVKIFRQLDRNGEILPGMVRVAGIEHKTYGKIDDFFIDRFEVTNKQFKTFIENGGYRNEGLWKHRFIKGGKELTRRQALAEFVDSTGRPGPATWQGGDYPEGQEDYPVSGISWYEAAAFAEAAHKKLPTGVHWGLARGGFTTLITGQFFSEFFVPQSNFKGKAAEAVGSNPAITAFGVYDMGGNVREWCWNETRQGRLTRGGAWNDTPYMFGNLSQLPPFDRSPKNGFRCVVYIHTEQVPETALASVEAEEFPNFYKQNPAPDPVFRAYQEQFSYDKIELNARVEWRSEASKEWIQERVSFGAAYDGERVFAYLFLPKNSRPPFQTVIYFPGSGAALARSSKDFDKSSEFSGFTDFIVKNGRALMFPIYKGTFERGDEALTSIHTGDNSHQYTDFFIKVVKDFRKSIDYLETRPDIDSQKLAYLGFSWGGMYGAIIPAVEERLKVSVLDVGGMGASPVPRSTRSIISVG